MVLSNAEVELFEGRCRKVLFMLGRYVQGFHEDYKGDGVKLSVDELADLEARIRVVFR